MKCQNKLLYCPAIFALVFLLFGVPGCQKKKAQSDDVVEIRFTYGPISHLAPLFAAYDNGYFKKRGIKMIMNNYQVNQKGGVKPLEAGELDGSALSFIQVVLAHQQGYHVKMVTSWGYGGPGAEQTGLVVLKDSPIKTVKELEGKKIGGFLKATEFGMQQNQLFEKHGVENCDHIEMSVAHVMGALQSGNIDAAQLIQPVLTIMADKIRVLARYSEVDARGFGFTEKFINENPDVIQKWCEALEEGVRFVKEHEDSARIIMSKWTNVPLEIAKKVPLPIWDDKNRIFIDGAERTLDWLEEQKLVTTRPKMEDLFDFRFTGKTTVAELHENDTQEQSSEQQ